MTTPPQAETDQPPVPQNPDDLGAEGNERLIAWAGVALLLGFAAQGLTLLNLGWYEPWHIMIGLALIPPVGVKIVATGYRFARYYTNTPAYRRKGPPKPLLRIIAPFVLLSTVMVLLTGVAILFAGSYRHTVEELHGLSFWVWLVLTSVHVLAYLWRLPRIMMADVAEVTRGGTMRFAAVLRIILVLGAGVVGLGVGVVLMPWIRAWVAG